MFKELEQGKNYNYWMNGKMINENTIWNAEIIIYEFMGN
jgi:hypothetical protein